MSDLVKVLKSNKVGISTKGNIRLSYFVDKIIESNNSEAYIKKTIDKFLIREKYYITPETYKKQCTEFFTVSTKYSIDYLLNHMKDLIKTHPLRAIKEVNIQNERYNQKLNDAKSIYW